MKKLLFFVVYIFAISATILRAQHCPDVLKEIEASGAFAPLFPFQPTHDAPDNLTNVRTWPGVDDRQAGQQGFISTSGSHFVDGDGNQIRFIGTQCGMTGCFPSHEQADNLVKEFTRYGINIVRMHYVSHRTPKQYPVLDSFIEPLQLEKFDYFIARLKESGIYVYFQLNIARKFGEVNGIVNARQLPKYKNGVDNLNERMIELQKRFHREILEHVNPYTGLAYKDEPCISMMELANENSIVFSWFNKAHKFPSLVDPYKGEFVAKWNEYLINKYGTTENLRKAWFEASTGAGEELMANANNAIGGTQPWTVQKLAGGSADIQFRKAPKRDLLNPYFLRMVVDATSGDRSEPRLYYGGISLSAGKGYCLKFKIRCDERVGILVRMAQNHTPWSDAGLKMTAIAENEWTEYKVNFTSQISDKNVRLIFNNFKPGVVDIADVSLTTGVDYDWPADQSLESRNIDWPYESDWTLSSQRAADFVDFLSGIERKYFTDLYDHTKNTLGIRHPVTGTQMGYGFNQTQVGMDYCDEHCYWCHPAFPGGGYDFTKRYNIRNEAIINSYGSPANVFTQVARSRILGKPYTVSEFDIPNLNFYCSEANLMMAALGAFQDWSALIQFSWILNTDYDRSHVGPMFDMCSATQKLVHFPACYAMFVRRDVRKGKDNVVFARPSELNSDIQKVAARSSSEGFDHYDSNIMRALPLAVVSGAQVMEAPEIYSTEGKTVIRTEQDIPENIREAFNDKQIKSSTGELTWNWQEKNAGYFMVDTRNTKVFSGFIKDRSFTYRGMVLTPGKTRLDWCTLSLTLTQAYDNARPGNILRRGSYLLAATGMVQNTDMKIVEVSKNPSKITTSPEDGGNLGTGPVLCEGIPATLSFAGLKDRVKCFALDPAGNRMQEVIVTSNPSGEALVEIGPQYRTVWYELIVD